MANNLRFSEEDLQSYNNRQRKYAKEALYKPAEEVQINLPIPDYAHKIQQAETGGKMIEIILGIDPGQTGGLAVITPSGTSVWDTPTEMVKKGKTNKTEYLPASMADMVRILLKNGIHAHCYIEKVGAMPGQGVTSMFGFGKGFGLWIGILAALRVPYTLVTPQAWKKEIMQGVSDKDAARGVAMRLFPELSSELSRKKDIGRADALLIAEYGRRIQK
jgi:crossover junction endodeoxyribonuclease RuvC